MRIRYHRTEPTRAMTIVFLRAIVALLIMAAAMSQIGCESAPQKPKTVSEAIVAAQTTVTTAANTLADLADAGIVSRESDDYRRIADALLEGTDRATGPLTGQVGLSQRLVDTQHILEAVDGAEHLAF